MPVWIWFFLAILAGAFIPVQTGMNVRLSQSWQHPLLASLAVFLIGAATMALAALASRRPLPDLPALAAASPVDLFGGVLAAAYIVALLTVAPKLGAAPTVAGVIVGQLVCSVVLDHFGLLGFPEHSLAWQRVAGLCLLVAGAYLVRRF